MKKLALFAVSLLMLASLSAQAQMMRVRGTMQCEVFCEIGLEFKRRSAQQPAFMVELNHGYFGYLTTPRQHKLGGY